MQNPKFKIAKEISIGFIIGLLTTTLGTYLWILLFSEETFLDSLKNALEFQFLGAILSLGALLNFIAFYFFLNKNQIYKARGVVMASFTTALVVFFLKIY